MFLAVPLAIIAALNDRNFYCQSWLVARRQADQHVANFWREDRAMARHRCAWGRSWLVVFAVAGCLAAVDTHSLSAQSANRLTYLDEFLDPYYVGLNFPKLTTPQWVGEPGVHAVVVLAIDDMRDTKRYEAFLRPILNRLKQIDGRAPVSIMTCTIDPADPQLQQWLAEGLSIEVHTITHPCPCLRDGDYQAARRSYEDCVDLMAAIPGNHPVAFRMPCCDSLNTPSPRFWAEIFNKATAKGNFLSIDSSVFQIFTPADPQLQKSWVLLPDNRERFRRYLPFPSFVNTIENYPYPYLIGRVCWELPCMVPSDWEAQNVQRPNNPDTVRDWKIALDAVVEKQGVFNLVFHPHNWIRNDQIVELIDYATQTYGDRVRFLTFRECSERLEQHLLGGHALRRSDGYENGVRLLDVDGDGWLDVIVANESVRKTRRWLPADGRWIEQQFPVAISLPGGADGGVRFGIVAGNQVLALKHTPEQTGAWCYEGSGWREAPEWVRGLTDELYLAREGRDQGVRLRDLDGDGTCELLVANDQVQAVWRYEQDRWRRWLPMPETVRFVDEQGRDAGLRLRDLDGDGWDDLVFSDHRRFGVYLWRVESSGTPTGWSVPVVESERPSSGEIDIPMIVRAGTNNGAWFHSGHLWVQNEDTSRLPDHVDRRSFRALLGEVADMPPPRSPQQSLRVMHVHPRCRVQLVASEPLVVDPIAFEFGLDGSLYVVEMRDYPNGVAEGALGRVKRLWDDDQDGVFDRADVFLDNLLFPTGVKVWRDGLLVLCPPELLFVQDRDGDGRAEHREVWFRGFAPGNPQHRANGLRWGMDGWLYIANGDSGGIIESVRTKERLSISGRDLRIRPDTGQMETVSGQTQYGRCRDDWDNWFGGNNSNPLWHYVLPEQYLRRNEHWPAANPRHDVPEIPGSSPVYPRSITLARFNDFHMANRFTSACSPEIYRDRVLGESFTGNAFICEPVHNLVHRLVLEPDGVTFRGHRATEEQQSEFLASEDNWFRPVMIRTGPDGALWIADMYRLVIEHPEWIPQAWQQKLDLRAGEDRGRIWRVIPAEGGPLRLPQLVGLSLEEWVRLLDHDNGPLRDLAQQQLYWQNARSMQNALEQLVRGSTRLATRAQALATLDLLEILSPVLLEETLQDASPQVRRFAVRLAARFVSQSSRLAEQLQMLAATEPDLAVVWEILCVLGEVPRSVRLWPIAERALQDRFFHAAFASSLRAENVEAVCDELIAFTRDRGQWPPDALAAPVIRFLAATQKTESLARLLESWVSARAGDQSAQRRRLELLGILLEYWPEALRKEPPQTVDRMRRVLEEAQQIVLSDEASIELKAVAARVIWAGASRREQAVELLARMLSPRQPPQIQAAAVEGLSRFRDPDVADRLLEGWRYYSPGVRSRVLDVVLSRTEWSLRLLTALEQDRVTAADLDAARRRQLLTHPAEPVRRQAERLLTPSGTPDRQQVLERYAEVKTFKADRDRGKALFVKHCAACHRLDEVGYAVGPDLAALSDKSLDALLIAVLDPNRAVEDKYREYVAVLEDGRQVRGVLVSESAQSVTLLAQEGRAIELLRRQLEMLVATGKSLMPEGVENDISVQEMADLFAYIRSVEGTPKSFPGNRPRLAHVRDDGSIRLAATDCRIYGPTLVFEELYRNLGYWGSTEDRAVWDIDVPRAGIYRVVLDYACHNDTSGNRFRIEIADQVLVGSVEGTGTWDQYRRTTVGKVELAPGRCQLVIRAEGPLQGYLMDLREIVLDPE